METSKVISSDKATVVIQANPQVTQNAVFTDDGQKSRGSHHNTTLMEFIKAQPKALGTVQIMTGVVVFLCGIVRTLNVYIYPHPHYTFISGVTYWGSLVCISAGSLSVAAENKLHPCVVKASLIMNVFSAITAVAAITLMSIELSDISRRHCHISCSFQRYNLGMLGILLVLSILQFIISICISGFACKATSDSDSIVVNVTLNQRY